MEKSLLQQFRQSKVKKRETDWKVCAISSLMTKIRRFRIETINYTPFNDSNIIRTSITPIEEIDMISKKSTLAESRKFLVDLKSETVIKLKIPPKTNDLKIKLPVSVSETSSDNFKTSTNILQSEITSGSQVPDSAADDILQLKIVSSVQKDTEIPIDLK